MSLGSFTEFPEGPGVVSQRRHLGKPSSSSHILSLCSHILSLCVRPACQEKASHPPRAFSVKKETFGEEMLSLLLWGSHCRYTRESSSKETCEETTGCRWERMGFASGYWQWKWWHEVGRWVSFKYIALPNWKVREKEESSITPRSLAENNLAEWMELPSTDITFAEKKISSIYVACPNEPYNHHLLVIPPNTGNNKGCFLILCIEDYICLQQTH